MKKILVTGGTVFVSKTIAEYFVKKKYDVYVINRKTKKQPENVTLIECDRNNIGSKLKGLHFDSVIDVNAYTKNDVKNLIEALDSFTDYVLISSSAVYPENLSQPFNETQTVGYNSIWKDYGTNKIEAEQYVLENVPQAYILRPPYLYGPMENIYRAAFIFDCAINDRVFYLPRNGEMKLQFYHVEDLCRFINIILEKHPNEHIFNVGNEESISVYDWVKLCYDVVGKEARFENVFDNVNQRNYFCFNDYEYKLDISRQKKYLDNTKALYDGLTESFEWYQNNKELVQRRDYFGYIDKFLRTNL